MSLRDVQQRFDRAAQTFDSADFVYATTRDGLLRRLEPMTITARTIVDLGSATGSSARRLSGSFRRAVVVAVDLSHRMLEEATSGSSWFSKKLAVQADAANLPFADHSIDLVFSNLLLPWISDRAPVFAEVSRVLGPNGLFAFSTLGPDSLTGLHHEPFADMHDVGDELVRAGLLDPVLDIDRLTVTYKDRRSLQRDLRAVGAGDCLPDNLDSFDQQLELVYGHCWGGGKAGSQAEVRIDPGQISRRRR